MQPQTSNASSVVTATALADAHPGRFRGLIIRKVGKIVGGERVGDDLVHVVMFGGFLYGNLVQRSLDRLPEPATEDEDTYCDEIVGYCARRNLTDKNGTPIGDADVRKALADLRKSFNRTLDPNQSSASSTQHVFDPLVVDGTTVRGGKVYKCVADQGRKCHCRTCTGDKRAPLPGQINLSGLKIGQTVIEAAENGPIPPTNSRADVVAKRIIRSRLPIGRYVSYRLEPGQDYILRVGPEAALAASKDGVTCDSDKVQQAADLLAA